MARKLIIFLMENEKDFIQEDELRNIQGKNIMPALTVHPKGSTSDYERKRLIN
jgi:hypothetical protein